VLNDRCWVCGTDKGLQCHHIFGKYNRRHSTEDGLMVWLCMEHHTGRMGVHQNRELMDELRRYGQTIYEREHTREEFMQRYGKNYL